MKITLTTTENQKNNTNNNMTTIDLGECEYLLRKEYNISDEKKLYIKKIDVVQEGLQIPKVEYDVYSKLNDSKLIKLNLTICDNSKIILSIPISLSESLEKLNSSSNYYNDICYTASSDSGADISLTDRKKEYVEGNKTVCQDDCDFSEYDDINKKAKCKCDVKKSSSSFADMKIDKEKLYKSFVDIKNIANIKLMKCYDALFNEKSIISNIASYLITSIELFHIIIIIIFYISQKIILFNKIKDISFGINNVELIKEQENNKVKKRERKKLFRKKTENIIQDRNKKENNHKEIKLILPNNSYNFKKGKKYNKKHNPPVKRQNKINKKVNNNINNIVINNEENSKRKINKTKKDNQEIIKKVKEIMKYNDEELNNLEYNSALQYDKRTYIEYYISLLKTKHILLFSFCYNNDYNSRIIKIDLFFISFTIYYTVNALFFSDDTMHKIYEDEGSFNFIYQLPQIIYSSLISAFLNMLLKRLALSEGNILYLKKSKDKKNLDEKVEKLKNKISIKFILYFFLSFIFLLFFWYYLSMFGAIYRNTQKHLIKDTLISFGLSLIYPFFIYLLPGFFRIPALSNPKNKKICLYKFSKILQIF